MQQSFVWNATNTTSQMRMKLTGWFSLYKARVKIVYDKVYYQRLYGQNRDRETVVPHTVLDKLARKREVPASWEAHEVIYHVT